MQSRRFALVPALVLAAVVLSLVAAGPPAGVREKWADPALPASDGLELWLDAGRLNAARQAQGQSALKSGEPVETWWDGSGRGRHVRQPAQAARPRLVQVGDGWVVRFDGVDDHLRWTGPNHTLPAFTAFIVAAVHDNPGEFRAFLAANQTGQRDYETGFTIDQSAGPTTAFEQVNVEGRGFGGARNLLSASSPFGTLHILEAVAAPDKKTVQLFLDGQPAGARPFAPAALRVDEITVGARCYTNGPGPQQVRGFLPGDIAEVLLYNRVLTPAETSQVRQYLERKHAKLKAALPVALKQAGLLPEPLARVADPPPVQMLVPGFTVRQLPVDLTNINNVKYRDDGKLVALAYNGNIYLLTDTDGDGLEDKADLFWKNQGQLHGPIGLALTPPGYKHGRGVFVPSKGKLSLIVDTDGDDKADKEIIVAQGWKEIPQAVDALGVALDKDGSIYFALGTANFANAYLIEKDGTARYDLKSERGTIQKVSPDFAKRETVCTGVRFPVALAFNRHGDLFCTDQEGATWLPNGNPFDELLHIQPGRHYGFPPRHPRHLPGVIDEPSVYDYGPQHQSTCGLNFNEPVHGGPTFGPAGWAGDALVCGESRGKLYRTKLVKTPAGYVAHTQIIACLTMLTVDACVSPHGDLVVTVHSGPPDWGTGPNGKGRLYKISYTDQQHPQPAAVWAAGPQEVRIAFDRPLDPEHLKQLTAQTKIIHGPYVRAGDRFEVLRPPYQVVHMQLRSPRLALPVYSAQVTADRRTLILTTAPMRAVEHYAITLPGLGRPAKPDVKAGVLPQHPQIDLDYQLTGVVATWEPKAGEAPKDIRTLPKETQKLVRKYFDALRTKWSGWLPHLDLDVSQALTQGSAAHEQLWQVLQGPGTLTLRTQLHLTDMLRPAVQPGSQLDHEWPAETVTLTVSASCPFTLRQLPARRAGDDKPAPALQAAEKNGRFEARLTVTPKPNEPVPVELVLTAGGRAPRLTVAWHTAEDDRPRALPLHRLLLPWAELGARKPEAVVRRTIPELEGGSWGRGRRVFFSADAACFKCHALHGQGGAIGPDLSNLVHRDCESVLRDLAEPSYAINPDYITYIVESHSGQLLTGTLRTEGDRLLIGDEKGQVTAIQRTDIARLQPTAKSTMPEGLPQTLGPERMKDLLTFLLTEPPRMPQYAKGQPPPPRTRAEVQAVLAGAPNPPAKTRPIHIVLVAGKKDHGPGEHDYPAWQTAWAELLSAAENTKVTTAWEWPTADDFKSADVLVFYQHGSWTPQRATAIDAYLARGGGLVYIHWAVDGSPDAPAFAQRIGLAAQGGQIKYRHGWLELGFETGAKHPIGRNFRKVRFHDESYWRLTGDPQRITRLASSVEDGEPQPQFWTLEPGQGRVVVSILGHYAWTFDDPLFRVLLLRGIAWAAREPVDRFNDLVPLGARMTD
jgi:putative heme-binding domain-containing protein